MSTKTVCQLDEDGYFVGTVQADVSPLEPDIYLIPEGCIEATPPTLGNNQKAKWSTPDWILEDIPDPHPEVSGEQAMIWLRMERTALLSETDWWANSDRTMSDAESQYRQALRDLPETYPNPSVRWVDFEEEGEGGYEDWVNVTWPTKP